jgi:type 1 glutamine amidotransferase
MPTIRSGFGTGQLAAALVVLAATVSISAAPKKLLVVTVTKGYRHSSIPTAERLVERLGQESGGFTVDFARTDEDLASKMTPKALDGYDGVAFLSTTGDLPLPDRDAFLAWLARGHAFVGVHAATDTFHGWPPYLDMIGGEFQKHGPQVKVSVVVEDKAHPATRDLASPFEVFDEIYEFQRFDRARVHPLLALDKHPQQGTPGFYPLAWTRSHDKGRVFYTALGHREDVLEAPWFARHVLGGITWALGISVGR